MITRVRYIALMLIFAVVFIMFQFIGGSTEFFFTFNTNDAATRELVFSGTDVSADAKNTLMCFSNPNGKICIVADTDENGVSPLRAVEDAAYYLKLDKCYYPSLQAIDLTDMTAYSLLVIGKSDFDIELDRAVIDAFTSAGINIIYAVMPSFETISQYASVQGMLGISRFYLRESMELDGVTVFEKFFIGGKAIYDECEKFSVPYYRLQSGTKAYVVGIVNEQKDIGMENEDLPHLVWRNSYNGAFIFCFNCDYLQKSDGLGFFIAVLSEMTENFVYPVINAQTMTLQNFPTLSRENEENLKSSYSQTMENFYQISVWPSIVSVTNKTFFKPASFVVSRYSYSAAQDDGDYTYRQRMLFYLKQLKSKLGEIGISGYSLPGDEPGERLRLDLELFSRILPDYKFTLFSTGGLDEKYFSHMLEAGGALESITTMVTPLESDGTVGRYEFYNDRVVVIPTTTDGYTHTNEQDITERSLQTALAASNVSIDAARIVYPSLGDGRDWVALANDWARFTHTFWYPYKSFDRVTMTEADARVRKYLALSFTSREENDTIYIEAKNFSDTAYFILDTRESRIVAAENATYEKLGDGSYLLNVTAASASVKIEKSYEMELS